MRPSMPASVSRKYASLHDRVSQSCCRRKSHQVPGSSAPGSCAPANSRWNAPEEGKPSTTSPGTIFALVMIFDFFDRTDGKTGQIVFAFGIHVRHFGRFTTDQCATSVFTALCNPLNNAGGRIDIELAAGEVIQENSGSAPCTSTSLTLMATRSMPTVSWRLRSKASLSLVPTPSVPETSTGSV